MNVLALILACSLHPDDAFVRKMVDIQSNGNVLFVGDLATLKTNETLFSVEDAVRVVGEMARKGGRPAVGLLGVPIEWAARFGHDVRDLFDGCTNLEIGSAMFSEYEAECSSSRALSEPPSVKLPSSRRRRHRPLASLRGCILRRLSRDLGLESKPSAVLKLLAQDAAQPKRMDAVPSQSSSVFTEGRVAEDWSSPRIFFNPGLSPTGQP